MLTEFCTHCMHCMLRSLKSDLYYSEFFQLKDGKYIPLIVAEVTERNCIYGCKHLLATSQKCQFLGIVILFSNRYHCLSLLCSFEPLKLHISLSFLLVVFKQKFKASEPTISRCYFKVLFPSPFFISGL